MSQPTPPHTPGGTLRGGLPPTPQSAQGLAVVPYAQMSYAQMSPATAAYGSAYGAYQYPTMMHAPTAPSMPFLPPSPAHNHHQLALPSRQSPAEMMTQEELDGRHAAENPNSVNDVLKHPHISDLVRKHLDKDPATMKFFRLAPSNNDKDGTKEKLMEYNKAIKNAMNVVEKFSRNAQSALNAEEERVATIKKELEEAEAKLKEAKSKLNTKQVAYNEVLGFYKGTTRNLSMSYVDVGNTYLHVDGHIEKPEEVTPGFVDSVFNTITQLFGMGFVLEMEPALLHQKMFLSQSEDVMNLSKAELTTIFAGMNKFGWRNNKHIAEFISGLAKKNLISDNVARYNKIYTDPRMTHESALFLAHIYFGLTDELLEQCEKLPPGLHFVGPVRSDSAFQPIGVPSKSGGANAAIPSSAGRPPLGPVSGNTGADSAGMVPVNASVNAFTQQGFPLAASPAKPFATLNLTPSKPAASQSAPFVLGDLSYCGPGADKTPDEQGRKTRRVKRSLADAGFAETRAEYEREDAGEPGLSTGKISRRRA